MDWFFVSGSGNTTLITDFGLGIDRLINGSNRASFADTSEGLRLNFMDGATAIVAGLNTSNPDWDLYV